MTTIRYELPNLASLALNRLQEADVTDEISQVNLALLSSAYTAEFEKPGGLPTGFVVSYFRPHDTDKIRQNRDRIISTMAKGSAYWHIVLGDEQIGLGKASPSFARGRVGRARGDAPNLYVNDVIVSPIWQRQRLGSTLLHGMAKFSPGYNEDAKVVADVFQDSLAEEKLQDIGFVPTNRSLEMNLGDFTLPQVRYETRDVLSKAWLIGVLEKLTPALAQAHES